MKPSDPLSSLQLLGIHALRYPLPFLVLLRYIVDGKTCSDDFGLASVREYPPFNSIAAIRITEISSRVRTGRKTLLELVGLIRILQNQRVEEAVAPDFELDLLRFPVPFYTGSYRCTLSFRNV